MSTTFRTDVEDDFLNMPNFSLGNAALVLEALGFDTTYLMGDCEISKFRQACIKALAAKELPSREEVEHRMPARRVESAIIPGGSFISCGCDQDGVRSRISRVFEYVSRMHERGATLVSWD